MEIEKYLSEKEVIENLPFHSFYWEVVKKSEKYKNYYISTEVYYSTKVISSKFNKKVSNILMKSDFNESI